MNNLSEQILQYVMALPEGVPVSAKSLLRLGTRAAVDQALSRLTRRHQLIRAGRGLYVAPVKTPFGERSPSLEKTIKGLAHERNEAIASHGEAAANALGLTHQVPIRPIYLTTGRGRRITLGKQVVELRHAPRWQLTHAEYPAGEAIRALAWIGKENVGPAIKLIWPKLPKEEREKIVSASSLFPMWLASQISQITSSA